jgi:hypothetical protein
LIFGRTIAFEEEIKKSLLQEVGETPYFKMNCSMKKG